MGTALAVGTWMVITVSYRTEKRSIVAELVKRLKPTDITDTQRSAAAHDDPTEEMRKAAKEIAQWCLWRWDGISNHAYMRHAAGSAHAFLHCLLTHLSITHFVCQPLF